jgi:hypothetical protein
LRKAAFNDIADAFAVGVAHRNVVEQRHRKGVRRFEENGVILGDARR